jgi:hypothetical protein
VNEKLGYFFFVNEKLGFFKIQILLSTKFCLKLTCTNRYQHTLEPEMVRNVLNLTTPYFCHFPQCKIYNICIPTQHARSHLQSKLRVQFHHITQKISFIIMEEHKLNVFKKISWATHIRPARLGLPLTALTCRAAQAIKCERCRRRGRSELLKAAVRTGQSMVSTRRWGGQVQAVGLIKYCAFSGYSQAQKAGEAIQTQFVG